MTGAISLAGIEELLQEAARVSNHRNFVIVGSLSDCPGPVSLPSIHFAAYARTANPMHEAPR